MSRNVLNSLPASQSGAVLIIGLIMLLLMTVVGLAAIRGSGMQELMAGNMRDRNIAFQTTESGLRLAELQIDGLTNNPFAGNGIWGDLNVPGAARAPVHTWPRATWTTNNSSLEAVAPELANRPRYVIERMALPIGAVAGGDGSGVGVGSLTNQMVEPDFFRITSRATGGTTTTEVVLQSTFKTFL